MILLAWSQLNGWLASLRPRKPHRHLIALAVALWGGAVVMVWHELDSVGGWLGVVLVLFIASYVPLAILGGSRSGHRVRRRSGPLVIALVVAIEGATVAALWYRLTLEAWLNLGLAFFAVGYLLLAILDGLRQSLRRWRPVTGGAAAAPPPAPVISGAAARGAALPCGGGAFRPCWPWWWRWRYWPTPAPGVRTLPPSNPHALRAPQRMRKVT